MHAHMICVPQSVFFLKTQLSMESFLNSLVKLFAPHSNGQRTPPVSIGMLFARLRGAPFQFLKSAELMLGLLPSHP